MNILQVLYTCINISQGYIPKLLTEVGCTALRFFISVHWSSDPSLFPSPLMPSLTSLPNLNSMTSHYNHSLEHTLNPLTPLISLYTGKTITPVKSNSPSTLQTQVAPHGWGKKNATTLIGLILNFQLPTSNESLMLPCHHARCLQTIHSPIILLDCFIPFCLSSTSHFLLSPYTQVPTSLL